MIPAPDWQMVLTRAASVQSGEPTADRLVSIVFASPGSLVIDDLMTNQVLWDGLTGDAWDLFFAGYFAYGGRAYAPDAIDIDRDPSRAGAWKFSPRLFQQLLSQVEKLSQSGGIGWRFSGGADLVSLMVYGAEPDWKSLRTVQLLDGRSTDAGYSTGQVIEGLRRWQVEEPDGRFAPGESPLGEFVPAEALAAALTWAAAAVVGNVLSDSATEMVRRLVS